MGVCKSCLLNTYRKASEVLLGCEAVEIRRPAVIKHAELCELIADFWSLWYRN